MYVPHSTMYPGAQRLLFGERTWSQDRAVTISVIPLPVIGWSGMHHIGGRSTTITSFRNAYKAPGEQHPGELGKRVEGLVEGQLRFQLFLSLGTRQSARQAPGHPSAGNFFDHHGSY
jgi:hypothetical protein